MGIEKVIKGLHDIGGFITGRIGIEQARNFLRTIDDVIELLKEQEAAYQGAEELLRQKTILFDDAIKRLKEQEVKTGHWIDTTNTIGFPRCECSECNSEAGAIWMKYCPNCGAKMDRR